MVDLTLLAIMLGGLVPNSGSEQSMPGPPPAMITVHIRRYYFSPAAITLKKGQTAKLVLISDDVRHGLVVKGLGIRAEIAKGQQTEVTIAPKETGDFPGSCSVYCGNGHRDMGFVIHVVD